MMARMFIVSGMNILLFVMRMLRHLLRRLAVACVCMYVGFFCC